MTTATLECLLDETPVAVDSGLKTWGDLLETVDRELARVRRAVTAVRFDGVDQPSFRDDALASRPLTALGRIEADSLDTRTLLHNTLSVAANGLAVLTEGAHRVAGAFRAADAAAANAELVTLVDGVRSLMTLTAAIAAAADVDLESLACGAATGAHAIVSVSDALETLLAWQQTRDRDAIADGLDLELAPALAGWRDLLDAISERARA
jgi:hypothetical protein